ncbi:ankyrin repeat domain-containing protein SOWAHA-like isoform X2 [Ornithodoros turicata]|uniref:ankyrin repeat domain-containing protein SOWAHA-like isoform X2 n=1 Tax=Ornithodoros turicata TaxID=34597 RepID=UPI0031388904
MKSELSNSFQGYTPLHLAAMFQHHHITELLTTTYGADRNIRDHSGRKAEQYLAGVGSLCKNEGKKTQQPSATCTTEKDIGFMRMGSFNSRVKRTAAAITGSFGSQKLKPWGSADSVMDNTVCIGMLPPKHAVKKKKSKKIELPSSSSMESLKSKLSITPSLDSDSDSTCGFTS